MEYTTSTSLKTLASVKTVYEGRHARSYSFRHRVSNPNDKQIDFVNTRLSNRSISRTLANISLGINLAINI